MSRWSDAPDPPGRWLERGFRNAHGSRSYRLYVPATLGGRRVPLLLMLHGCSQTPEDFAAGTGMNVLAERTPLLVAYPAQHESANWHACWNWFDPAHQRREHGEPALLAGLTRHVITDYPVDPARVSADELAVRATGVDHVAGYQAAERLLERAGQTSDARGDPEQRLGWRRGDRERARGAARVRIRVLEAQIEELPGQEGDGSSGEEEEGRRIVGFVALVSAIKKVFGGTPPVAQQTPSEAQP